MHVRYIAAAGLALGSLALLAPACVAPVADASTQEEEQVDVESAAQEDAFKIYICKGGQWACLAECGRQGVACNPGAAHPTRSGSLGWLFGCVVTGRTACGYKFPPGDQCWYPKDGGPPMCTTV